MPVHLIRLVSTVQWGMAWPASLRVKSKPSTEAQGAYAKNPPSDSTPGSWNTPLNHLAADKYASTSTGLSIETQDMGSVLQLGPKSAGVDSGSGKQSTSQPGMITPSSARCETSVQLMLKQAVNESARYRYPSSGRWETPVRLMSLICQGH